MKRAEFICAGDEPGFQDFDSVQVAALAGADIDPRHELFKDTEHVTGDGGSVTPGADAELPNGGREPAPGEA
jgi:hypothetical protein